MMGDGTEVLPRTGAGHLPQFLHVYNGDGASCCIRFGPLRQVKSPSLALAIYATLV